jgi:hypothetical protein
MASKVGDRSNQFSTWQRMPHFTDLGIRIHEFIGVVAAYCLLRSIILPISVFYCLEHPDAIEWLIPGACIILPAFLVLIVGYWVKVQRKRTERIRSQLLPECPHPDAQIAWMNLGGSQSMSMPCWGYAHFEDGQLVFTSQSFCCRFNPSDEVKTKERFSIRFKYSTPVGERSCRIRFGSLDHLKRRQLREGFESAKAKLEEWRQQQPSQPSVYPPLKSAFLSFPKNYLAIRIPLALACFVAIEVGSIWMMISAAEHRYHGSAHFSVSEQFIGSLVAFYATYLVVLAVGYILRKVKRAANARIDALTEQPTG